MNDKIFCETDYNRPLIYRRADPFLCRQEDGRYYFTATVPAYDRIVLRSAETLEGILDEGGEKTLWRKHESGCQSAYVWAPELHYLYGGWYIYYAAGNEAEEEIERRIRPYVLHCRGKDPMKDEWEELGRMKAAREDEFSFRAFSLDMTVFEHKGEHYCVWAEKVGVGKQISNLYIARLEAPDRLSTVQVLLTTPDYGWERVGYWVNEGPAALVHGGRIFLTYSASATGACYCIGMLYADADADLLDPGAWTKLRHPVLESDGALGIYGPGHNSFAKAPDGETDLCIFHARQYEEIEGNPLDDPNRHVYGMKVSYDAEGFPVFRYQPSGVESLK